MGKFERIATEDASGHAYRQAVDPETGEPLRGNKAWNARYDASQGWGAFGLGAKVGAFVEGGANFITAINIPLKLAMGIMAVLVASFAATTLDTATRLQRYVIQELAATARIKPLTNKYAATLLAVVTGGAMAMISAPGKGPGTGGLILWPLFGAINQLLAGLALMVAVFYLWRRRKPIWFLVLPMLAMLIMPPWAMAWKMFNDETGWLQAENYLLLSIGGAVILLQIWIVIEGLLVCRRARGVLEEALPPLETEPAEA